MNVAVFFGGKSCEHNISIITGMQALQAIAKKHNVIPVYIDSNGVWRTGKKFSDINTYKKDDCGGGKRVHLSPASPFLCSEHGRKIAKIDVALLCNHGLNGEDGSLQGLLRLSGVPYTGSGVLASCVGMDKITMKRLFMQAGLNVLPFVSFSRIAYEKSMFEITERIKKELRFPLIVKPSNLGSSIGISIAHDFEELFKAVKVALMWDNSVLVENALEDFTELNCAVLGYGDDSLASEVEQPVGWTEFLTYDDKYLKKIKGGGRKFPAEIDSEMRDKVRLTAQKAFSYLGCAGVARVDFLLKDGELFINEINTIPGALSNYLFVSPKTREEKTENAEKDIDFEELIERLIKIALLRYEEEENLTYSYKKELCGK